MLHEFATSHSTYSAYNEHIFYAEITVQVTCTNHTAPRYAISQFLTQLLHQNIFVRT